MAYRMFCGTGLVRAAVLAGLVGWGFGGADPAHAVPIGFEIGGEIAGNFGVLDGAPLADVTYLLQGVFESDAVTSQTRGALTILTVVNDRLSLGVQGAQGAFDLAVQVPTTTVFVLNNGALRELQVNGTDGSNLLTGSLALDAFELGDSLTGTVFALFGPALIQTSAGLLGLDGLTGGDGALGLRAVALPGALPMLATSLVLLGWLGQRRTRAA